MPTSTPGACAAASHVHDLGGGRFRAEVQVDVQRVGRRLTTDTAARGPERLGPPPPDTPDPAEFVAFEPSEGPLIVQSRQLALVPLGEPGSP